MKNLLSHVIIVLKLSDKFKNKPCEQA